MARRPLPNLLQQRKTDVPIVRFYTGAQAFWRDAQALEDGIPRLTLALHAIELALKSFLISKGLCPDFLRRQFGHDLKDLLDKALEQEIGLLVTLPVSNNEILELVSEAQKNRLFLYEYTGSLNAWLNFADSYANALCSGPIRWNWQDR